MPFCPKCKTEYEEGVTTCADCGEKLVRNLPKEPKSKDAPYIDDDKEAFLVSVSEGFDTQMIEGSLRSANIPFVKKGHSGPEGFSRYDYKYECVGVDFYVPAKLLEKAKALIPELEGEKSENSTDVKEQTETNPQEAPENFPEGETPRRKFGIWAAIAFIIIGALVIFGVDYVMNILRSLMGYK